VADENKFDGQTPVSGYTLFHGKDGKSYYLKGESLSDEDVTQRVAKLRGSASTAGADTPSAQPTNAPTGVGKQLNDWWKTPSPDIRGGKWTPPGETRPESSSTPQQRLKNASLSAGIMASPFIGTGLALAPAATLMGLGGGVAGGVAGGYAGRNIGEKVGAPDIGEDIGGLLGSGFGGYVGSALAPSPNTIAGLMRRPATSAQSLANGPAAQGNPGTVKNILPSMLQKYTIPDWIVPKGEIGTPTNPGPFNKIPSKLSGDMVSDPFSPAGAGASRNSSPFGNNFQNGRTGEVPYGAVLKLPIPNEAMSPINPKYMGSVPRNTLVGMAEGKTPGAATQLGQVGNKVIYVPDTMEGSAGPKSVTNFSNPGSGITVKNAMGIRWASSADGKYSVSIPKEVPDEAIEEYAAPKLAEQAASHGRLFQ